MSRKRGSVAVVGAAESDLGLVAPHTSPVDLMAQATMRALDDAGLTLKDVDGLFVAATQVRMGPMALAEYLRIKPKYFDGTIIGGSSFMTHVTHAQAAIEAGLCEVAVIAYGSTQKTVSRTAAGRPEYNYYETPYKPFLPSSAYAMAAARHMHEFGTTREQLAEVAVAARKWALLNPKAWEKEPLSVEQVLNARMVSYPFTVRDCCLVVDGGGAIVITSAARAKRACSPHGSRPTATPDRRRCSRAATAISTRIAMRAMTLCSPMRSASAGRRWRSGSSATPAISTRIRRCARCAS